MPRPNITAIATMGRFQICLGTLVGFTCVREALLFGFLDGLCKYVVVHYSQQKGAKSVFVDLELFILHSQCAWRILKKKHHIKLRVIFCHMQVQTTQNFQIKVKKQGCQSRIGEQYLIDIMVLHDQLCNKQLNINLPIFHHIQLFLKRC